MRVGSELSAEVRAPLFEESRELVSWQSDECFEECITEACTGEAMCCSRTAARDPRLNDMLG